MERDFARVYRRRALDWVAGKYDWREFWRLKEGLKEGTEYFAAKLNDPEVAAEIAKQPRGKPSPPPLEGWTVLRADLADIKDHLTILASSMGGGTPTMTMRPVYEHERIREKQSSKRIRNMASKLIPGCVDVDED